MTQSRTTSPDPAAAAELIELYFEKGWTDGLPVTPPSEQAVKAMLDNSGLKGSDTVGVVSSRNTRITADKVAINAVMAGCRPDYMPVVVAAVKGVCHPDFGYHGPATSTGGAAITIIVNGPIAEKLGVNARDNAFGPGCRANMTIGRAVRLLMMNALNTRPGGLDRSTLGNPGKLSFCFAENEADSPWEPLHVERGFRPEESTATVFACEAVIQVYNQLSSAPGPLLLGMADAISNTGSMAIVGHPDLVIVLAGEHMEVMRKNGWNKAQVKQFLLENGRRSIADLKRAGRLPGKPTIEDESTFRHAARGTEGILVVPAGGAAGSFSACLLGWATHTASRSVTTRIEAI